MKKTISINIASCNFIIDEDAYNLLKDYLDTLYRAFGANDESREMVAEIEARIAEIITMELQGHPETPINIYLIKQVIAQIGQPEEISETIVEETIAGDTIEEKVVHEEATVPPPYPGNAAPKTRKRLYRDMQNKMIGGVCSGIGKYINLDPTWVRLITVALCFASFSVIAIVYVVLWIVVPEARTPIQIMEMEGEEPTMENIGRTVSSQHVDEEPAKKPKAKDPESTLKSIADNFAKIISFIAKILLILIGIAVVPIVFALCIALLVWVVATVIYSIGVATPLTAIWGDVPNFLGIDGNPVVIGLLGIGWILVLGIPLFLLVHTVFRSMFHWQPFQRKTTIFMACLWVVALITAGFTTGMLAKEYRDHHSEWLEFESFDKMHERKVWERLDSLASDTTLRIETQEAAITIEKKASQATDKAPAEPDADNKANNSKDI